MNTECTLDLSEKNMNLKAITILQLDTHTL